MKFKINDYVGWQYKCEYYYGRVRKIEITDAGTVCYVKYHPDLAYQPHNEVDLFKAESFPIGIYDDKRKSLGLDIS